MQRTVCLVLVAGTRVAGGGDTCPKADSPTSPPQTVGGARAFTGRGRGLRVETAQSALTVILKLVIGGLTSIILIVLSTVSLQFQGQFVPISCVQFSELWQLTSWLQSAHHVVNFFHLVGLSISTRQLTGYGSEYSP